MSRRKLSHFNDLHEWNNVYEPTLDANLDLKGTWGPKVILELACGKGDFALALAEQMPDAKIIGVDIKGARIWHGARASKDLFKNLAFLRARIEDLSLFFAENEVDEIWITFPDPHVRDSRSGKRLTSKRFLDIYKSILKPGASVFLKTDSSFLYDFTKEVLQENSWKIRNDWKDVYSPDVKNKLLHIQTEYEKRYLKEGRLIKSLEFTT